ncbi:MAG: hypothetical protein IPO85_10690 [Saprospiraceae bacterium]|uniref:Guanylate cyclase domain-containing protein n=1 Tax=Candidatus Defluviibacterium haderslevense TaxID=2981993 RepID=A0A9D7SA72_9BACT|nr:hypothetical protein [Candidatus Defluviibacterium haderslevense]
MAIFNINSSDYLKIKQNDKLISIIKKYRFNEFNPDILGLGKIDVKSTQINSLSAMFDLEGFTSFCKQIDPQLAVPEYLNDFLTWLFDKVRKVSISKTFKDGYKLYSSLPFLSKYLGDGILFLWNTDKMSDTAIRNVVVMMYEVCKEYQSEFLPSISSKITSAPSRLRCGIARGAIYSVGNGNDFVGPCINMSARLQKLNSLTFCFSRRGINPALMGTGYKDTFIIKKVQIRGIGEEELVCISKYEYNKIDEIERAKFINV